MEIGLFQLQEVVQRAKLWGKKLTFVKTNIKSQPKRESKALFNWEENRARKLRGSGMWVLQSFNYPLESPLKITYWSLWNTLSFIANTISSKFILSHCCNNWRIWSNGNIKINFHPVISRIKYTLLRVYVSLLSQLVGPTSYGSHQLVRGRKHTLVTMYTSSISRGSQHEFAKPTIGD